MNEHQSYMLNWDEIVTITSKLKREQEMRDFSKKLHYNLGHCNAWKMRFMLQKSNKYDEYKQDFYTVK